MNVENTNALAAIGHRILNSILVQGGPAGLNAAGHRVIHSLLTGAVAQPDDVCAGGNELAGRLVFGVVRAAELPPGQRHPAWLRGILLVVVQPDRNWRQPLDQLTPRAEPWLRDGEFSMRAWNLPITEEGFSRGALARLMGSGIRWSRRLQELVDENADTDESLVAWLHAHADGLNARLPVRRRSSGA